MLGWVFAALYSLYSLSLVGNRRVFGEAIDIGAYECQKVPGLKLFLR